jgi:hypothetical protein
MANLVGDLQPDAATTDKLLTKLRNVGGTWRQFGVNLSKVERKALLHARIGAEPHIARLHDIAIKYSVAIPDVPLQGMLDDLALYTMLRPFQDAFAAGLVLIDDTARQAEAEAWEAFLAYYGALSGMAPHQPVIAADLSVTREFMALGPREAPAPEPEAPKPTATPKPARRKSRRASGRAALTNRVGDRVPDPAVRAQLAADLDEVVTTWRRYGLVLNTAQRRGLLDARRGAEPHIARIQELAVKYGIDIGTFPLQGLANDVALYTTLRPFQDELRTGKALLDDTAGQAESEAWEAFLAYYGALNGMAKHHPALEEDMKPIVEFMSTGPRKPSATPAPKG